jgi:hypothetical protein
MFEIAKQGCGRNPFCRGVTGGGNCDLDDLTLTKVCCCCCCCCCQTVFGVNDMMLIHLKGRWFADLASFKNLFFYCFSLTMSRLGKLM